MEKENRAPQTGDTNADVRENGRSAQNFGKFDSVDALLSAYNSLEAEFTRRSQRLRELEGKGTIANTIKEQESGSSSQCDAKSGENAAKQAQGTTKAGAGEAEKSAEAAVQTQQLLAEEVRKAVDAYFAENNPPYIMAEGGSFSAAPSQRIRSLEEAGDLAKELFRKNG